ncbi:hypothetical protein LWI28_023274 [Acer negundo]|uniref:F-box protein n=1 Tax=Acer negundo TaxID=4023 RepID=A0AAD5J7L9_ACENE|nr:hypothetical protein LWI28_023274 [Acer negundo]
MPTSDSFNFAQAHRRWTDPPHLLCSVHSRTGDTLHQELEPATVGDESQMRGWSVARKPIELSELWCLVAQRRRLRGRQAGSSKRTLFTESTRCVWASKSSDSQRDILHSVSMAQVQWSDLPIEILPIIFQKLKDPCDVYRCGLVCVLWKSIATTILPPFLLLSNVGSFHFKAPLNKKSCSLFNTQTNETHEIFLPEVEKCWFTSSSFGWLLTICFEPPHEVHLLNPFTRDRIQLPLSREFRRPYDLRVITSTAPLNPTCLVLVIRRFQGALAFCRPGDRYWTFFDDFGRCDNDVAFYKGGLYAVNSFGHLVQIHCNSPVAQKVLPVCSTEFLQRGLHCYLVELDGNLLLVVRYTKELLTSGFEVYELDWVEKVWIKVKNIGNNAIFLGTGSSISLPTDHFRNLKENCIYFISDNLTSFFLKMDLMPMDNTGFYDMTTGQIEYLYDQASLIWLSSLNWFVPPSTVIYKQNSADVICRENSAEVICRDDKGMVKSWFSKIRRSLLNWYTPKI